MTSKRVFEKVATRYHRPCAASDGNLSSGTGIGAAVVHGDQVVQDGRKFVQAVQVRRGQLPYDSIACSGQADTYNAAIVLVRYPFDHAGGLGAVNQLHRAVRPQEQVVGQVAHGRRLIAWMSLDRHQQLVLHVGEACRLRLVLAPALELAQRDAEFQ